MKLDLRDVVELTIRFCEGLGDSRALTVAILVRYGEWDQLVSLSCDPYHYQTATAYASANASTSFLRKMKGLPTSFDQMATAYSRWDSGESDCYFTNERLERYLPEHCASGDRVEGIAEFISAVRKRIQSWIGFGPNDLTVGRHGPGSTFSDRVRRGVKPTIAHKMQNRPSFTGGAIWYLPQWYGTQWGSSCASRSVDPLKVKGNRFAVAPKDAKTHRGIAAEPSINIFFQLGLGSELRSRLRTIGLDLENGQRIHQMVAAEASITGDFATLDLSNASDTLASVAVKLLLPERWFSALDALRSPFTLIRGKWVRLEKFSSMGNGYTFELETLIFAALAAEAMAAAGHKPTAGRNLFVYGDDIIIPTSAVRSVTAVLRFFGFSLNPEKSFSDGPFRESCGGDFYNGVNVRGVYLRDVPTEPQHWIRTANSVRISHDRAHRGLPVGMSRAWFFALDRIPTDIRRCRGPQALGDAVIHDEPARWSVKWKHGIRYVRTFLPVSGDGVPFGRFHPSVVLACATLLTAWNDGCITPPSSVSGHKVGWTAYS